MIARGLVMQYPGTRALDHVDFDVEPAQVNVVVGENGAGKSTLMRILAGVERPTEGTITIDGRPVTFSSPRDAAAHGVAMIHQELNLLPNLSVAENIFMARELCRHGVIDRAAQHRRAGELMQRLEQDIDPQTLAGDLPLGQQQVVEIAKALAQETRVLIMDEPTSALSAAEIPVLFRLIRDLKSRGVAIVYISHHMGELMEIGDTITVLRDGRVVGRERMSDVNLAWIVECMTGGKSSRAENAGATSRGAARLRVRLPGTAFEAHAGEIVGFYGLMGAGRTELFETLIGVRPAEGGEIVLDGRNLEHVPISTRIAGGLALAPEERKSAGIVPTRSVLENMMTGARGWLIDRPAERARAARHTEDLNIRTSSADAPIISLSGGNQQKVVLARCLEASPSVLLLDQPTRGVDVAAREEIYTIIRRIAAGGRAVLFASSELEEVMALATRVLVMSGGRITAEFSHDAVNEHDLMAAAAGANHVQ